MYIIKKCKIYNSNLKYIKDMAYTQRSCPKFLIFSNVHVHFKRIYTTVGINCKNVKRLFADSLVNKICITFTLVEHILDKGHP